MQRDGASGVRGHARAGSPRSDSGGATTRRRSAAETRGEAQTRGREDARTGGREEAEARGRAQDQSYKADAVCQATRGDAAARSSGERLRALTPIRRKRPQLVPASGNSAKLSPLL